MRKRSPDGQESLDLLLDTITNAFGGIVFITILLALSIRTQSPTEESSPTQSVRPNEVSLSFAEFEELAGKKTELEAALTAVIQNPLSSSQNLQDLLIASQQLVGQISAKSLEQDELANSERKLEDRKQQVKSSMEALQPNFDQLQGEVSELEKRLSEEKEKRTVTSDLPSEQETNKTEVPYLVHGKRICSIFTSTFQTNISSDLESVSDQSNADFADTSGNLYRIGPQSGVSLDDADQVESYLSKRDASDEYVAVAVWSDSYAEFSNIKKACVKLGLEYRLILCHDNTVLSANSSVQGKVQ